MIGSQLAQQRITAALSRPNIFAVHDFGLHDGTACVAMELLDGETLRVRPATGALPAGEAVDVAARLARGLAAAHDMGIVHRDL